MQTKKTTISMVVLTGVALDGRFDWVFAPKGWDITALERRYCFSGTKNSPRRRCLLTPSGVRELIALYGEQPVVELLNKPSLSDLLNRNMLAVDVMLATSN
jgi:hypothetical protein